MNGKRPMLSVEKPRHATVEIDGLEIFYRRAGRREHPTFLLLHGFPSSSHSFREVIGPLARVADVVAPDLPGFGFSSSPDPKEFPFTFERLSGVVEQFLDHLGIDSFFVYLHDFGAPVGYNLALAKPSRILGIVVQSGNAHESGLGSAWDAAREFWADPTPERRAALPEWLNFEGTRYQYVGGLPDRLVELPPPESWHLDWERMTRPGNIEGQFALFCDYATHVARFEDLAKYHRDQQPPTLVLWGRHDPFFQVDEVLDYHRELETCEIHVFDSAHLLLETHAAECAELMARFVLEHASA
jgi:pimeloyl-ACP methyl ester carboxylesterase